MNVRKPLLSTSALKHRCVTIIFNRIIFRTETVNLVSHDCHSYLHITLTNGIPSRKALVMAGENATNDVDEEVWTAEPHSNICSELHMYHLCACLVNRYSLWFPIMKCEQPNWRTDGSVVAGGDETHRLTNIWWGRNMVCFSADQFAENHLENNGVDVKRSKLEGRSGILTWKWILEYLDQLWNHVETRECRQLRHRWKFLQYLHLHLRQKSTYPKCEVKECTRKRLGSGLSGQKSAELPYARLARLLVQGSHTPVNARRIKMPGKKAAEQHQRRRRDAELLEIRTLDCWTRVRVQQIPIRRDQKTTFVTDNENSVNQMDEDNFAKRTSDISSTGTSRWWKRAEEGTSGKKRFFNSWRERCEIWCQRGSLAERRPGDSSDLWRRLDWWTARRQSQGRRWTRNPADERSAAVLLGQGDWHTSQQINSAHRLGSTIEGEWSEIEMCAEGFRYDSERWCICANTFSIVSAWAIAVCSMVRSSSGN